MNMKSPDLLQIGLFVSYRFLPIRRFNDGPHNRFPRLVLQGGASS